LTIADQLPGSSADRMLALHGAVRDAWQAQPRWRPVGDARQTAGGVIQHVVDAETGALATICAHPIAGTRWVTGAIRDKWHETGAQQGRLGWPCEDATATIAAGGMLQQFAGDGTARMGAIASHPATGTCMVRGAIHDAWLAAGGERVLGLPECDTTLAGDGRGAYNQYRGATRSRIYWVVDGRGPPTGSAAEWRLGSIDHGIFVVPAPILDAWRTALTHSGPLGYPIGSAKPDRAGGLTMAFEHGAIAVSARGEVTIDHPAFAGSTAARLP
jgi:uncharacterized protein with LGFP repeats